MKMKCFLIILVLVLVLAGCSQGTDSSDTELKSSNDEKTSVKEDDNNEDLKDDSNLVESESGQDEKKENTETVDTTKTTTSTDSITNEKKDSSKEETKTEVIQEGQKGDHTNTHKETGGDVKLASKEENSSEAKKTEITTKTTTSTKAINFDTIEQKDASMVKGKTSVVQEGQKGVRIITYKETYQDGKLVSKEEVSSKITKQPVDKIINVGTKVNVTGLQFPLGVNQSVVKNELFSQAIEIMNVFANGMKNKNPNAMNNYIDKNIDKDYQSSLKQDFIHHINGNLVTITYMEEYIEFLLAAKKSDLKITSYEQTDNLLNVYVTYNSNEFNIGERNIHFLFMVSPLNSDLYVLNYIGIYPL